MKNWMLNWMGPNCHHGEFGAPSQNSRHLCPLQLSLSTRATLFIFLPQFPKKHHYIYPNFLIILLNYYYHT